MAKKEKVDKGYKTSSLIIASFGYGAAQIFNFIYQQFAPLIINAKLSNLGNIVLSATVVSGLTGFIMSIDNILALFMAPIIGQRSDHTYSKFGKRFIYLLIGIPVCAVLFILIPVMAKMPGLTGIIVMSLAIVLFNIFYFMWRTPCHAIMADIVPEKYQSDGNAVFNIAGAVAAIFALLGAAILEKAGFGEALNSGDYTSIFVYGSVIALILLVCMRFGIKWKDNRADAKNDTGIVKGEKTKLFNLKEITDDEETRKDLLLVIILLFCVAGASDAYGTYYSLFATKELAISASKASSINAMATFGAVLFAVPAGVLGRKKGRKFAVRLGLIVCTLAHVAMFMLPKLAVGNELLLTLTMFIWDGFFVFININVLPILLTVGGESHFGSSVGLYNTSKTIAAIVLPTVFGVLIGSIGSYTTVHILCIILYAIGFVLIGRIRKADVIGEEENKRIEEAMKEADDD